MESGTALSTTFAKHRDVFPPLMINMVRAGEVGGFLDQVLLQLAENFESEVALRAKVKSAMTYPVVVFVIAIIAVVAMLLFVVPVFAKMFSDMGGVLPLPTQILVWMSHGMTYAAPVGVVLVILFPVLWKKVKDRRKGRDFVDPLKLKVPVFGMLAQKIALSRFTRTSARCSSPGCRSCSRWRSSGTRAETSSSSGLPRTSWRASGRTAPGCTPLRARRLPRHGGADDERR